MQHLADLLALIPLPEAEPIEEPVLTRLPASSLTRLPASSLTRAPDLVHDLGADLPAGHLHVWGGPAGAGKTSFLLSLLHAAAARGRRVAYATYDLAPESLSLRMLAMAAGIELDALPDPGGRVEDCTLAPEALERTRVARSGLSRLPFSFLAARGFSVDSLRDRIVRMPFRAEVLAVDYLQGVIREPGTEMGVALRALSDLAAYLHVAIICAVRPQESREEADLPESGVADRMGWIAPTATPTSTSTTTSRSGAAASREADGCARRSASIVHNRHGERTSVPLELDEANGNLERAAE